MIHADFWSIADLTAAVFLWSMASTPTPGTGRLSAVCLLCWVLFEEQHHYRGSGPFARGQLNECRVYWRVDAQRRTCKGSVETMRGPPRLPLRPLGFEFVQQCFGNNDTQAKETCDQCCFCLCCSYVERLFIMLLRIVATAPDRSLLAACHQSRHQIAATLTTSSSRYCAAFAHTHRPPL